MNGCSHIYDPAPWPKNLVVQDQSPECTDHGSHYSYLIYIKLHDYAHALLPCTSSFLEQNWQVNSWMKKLTKRTTSLRSQYNHFHSMSFLSYTINQQNIAVKIFLNLCKALKISLKILWFIIRNVLVGGSILQNFWTQNLYKSFIPSKSPDSQ